MNTLITTPRHFRLYGAVLAMAALLITLLAATMTAGPTMAQADDGKIEPRTGVNAEEYSKPYPCSEEVEPDANTAEIVRDGFHAVFDAFWDYEVGHLSNNFCPPKVEQTTKSGFPPTTVNTREDAQSHISKTVYSVPESYAVTVVDSGNGNSGNSGDSNIDLADFPFLTTGDAVSAGDSIYWVKLDNPVIGQAGEYSPLQVGFSTGLMEEADWYRPDGPDNDTDPDPPVQFHFTAVHVLKDGTPEEAHVLGAHFFAFDPGASQDEALWNNAKTDTESKVYMSTGEYRPMQLVFTKPGGTWCRRKPRATCGKKRTDWTASPRTGVPSTLMTP